MISSISVSENSYAYLTDANGNVIVHPTEDLILNYNIAKDNSSMEAIAKDALAGKEGNGSYKYDKQTILCGFSPIENTNNWTIMIAAPEGDFTQYSDKISTTCIVLDIIAVLIAIVFANILATYIAKPINRVKEVLTGIAKGDFSMKPEKSKGTDELAILQNTTASLLDTLSNIIRQANQILDNIANYDLTTQNMSDYPGEFNQLSTSVNTIKSTRKLIGICFRSYQTRSPMNVYAFILCVFINGEHASAVFIFNKGYSTVHIFKRIRRFIFYRSV